MEVCTAPPGCPRPVPPPPTPASDLAHASPRSHEGDLADAVAGPLGAHGGPDGPDQVVIAPAAAQDLPQVVLVDGEQAGAQLALGRQADPVAVPAEGLGHRGDDPDLTPAVEVAVAATVSAAGTTWSMVQPPEASRGMNSMNRGCTPFSLPKVAKSTASSSLRPRTVTTLSLTGSIPASRAASIPSSTRGSWSLLVTSAKRSGRSESQEMLTRRRPAARRSPASSRRVAPLVVMARSTGSPVEGTFSPASISTRTGRWARTVGSPPVRRMDSTPRRSTQTRATRPISSKVSSSSRGSQDIPSSGMQ